MPWDLRAQVVAGNQYWGTAIDGVTPEFVTGRDWRVATGRFCTKAEEESAATVAVLGPTVDLSHPSHSLAFCLHGASQGDVELYVMINAYWEDLRFTIQEGKGGPWQRVIDTSLDSPDDVCEPGAEVRVTSQTYVVKARSIVVLSRHREGDHNTPW